MPTILLRLDPSAFDNPDADIRYMLPDLLAERSGGTISDNGYDYVDLGETTFLVLFLKTADLQPALACVMDVIESVRVLNNDLRLGVVVAVESGSEAWGQRRLDR
mgnify:CR=1 FL=1